MAGEVRLTVTVDDEVARRLAAIEARTAAVDRLKEGALVITIDRRPIRQRLAEFYTEAEIELWLQRPHPQLGGTSPWHATTAGRSDDVHRIIDRLDEGAYL